MLTKKGRQVVFGAGLAALATTGAAHATLFTWNFTAGQPQPPGHYVQSDAGGAIKAITSTFDDVSRQLTFSVDFSDRITDGFYMGLNNGPLPNSRPGQIGLVYFDAGDVFDGDAGQNIFMTAYGYNGANDGTTWRDGDGATAGDQAPDLIRGINDTSWINSLTAADVVLMGGVNGRRFTFSIDAGPIISHTPLYPDAGSPWYGIGFDTLLGIWFHPFDTFDVTYNAQGGIATWNWGPQGWLDGDHFEVPSPGTAGLVLIGAAVLAGRRRRR
jgi:MYXO-CTERM domain-containing protein